MTGKVYSIVAAIAACGICAAQNVSISQDGRPERMAAIRLVHGLNKADSSMLQHLYWGNAFEIMAGKIAQNRGHSTWTTEFGREMVHEHSLAQAEVKQLAMDRGVSLNNDLPRPMANQLQKLRTTGNFDAAFKQAMLSSHAGASNLLKHAIKYGHDETVRGLAVKLEPSVVHHYELAMAGKTLEGPLMPKNGM